MKLKLKQSDLRKHATLWSRLGFHESRALESSQSSSQPTASSPHTSTRLGALIENLRTGGRDPILRKGMAKSFFLHACLIIIPLLAVSFHSCENVDPPGGSITGGDPGQPGNPTPPKHEIVYVKKMQPRSIITGRSSSPYRFDFPRITDDAPGSKKMDEESQQPFTVDVRDTIATVDQINSPGNNGMGGIGTGHGGTGHGPGGWKIGLGNDPVRFFRLLTDDPTCNDGNDDNADANLLARFHQSSGIKTKTRSDLIAIRDLAHYPVGHAPPFVYLTGRSELRLSDSDVKALREYIQSGGMIFADAGSNEFGQSFRNLMARLFPSESLRVIADDDVIFRSPNVLPNGAPAVFHHDGAQAMGIKFQNRWAVFYHPGSLKDLWRTSGSHATQDSINRAYQTGINVICYAYAQYFVTNARRSGL